MATAKKTETVLRDTVALKPNATSSSSSTHARALRSGVALREGLLVLLETESFDRITIKDICHQAHVHYATFFRHYQTKEALLDDIAKEQIQQLNQLTMGIRAASNIPAGFRALCQYVDEHRALWSRLLNGGAGAAMREEWMLQSAKVAQTEPPANTWLPPALGAICAATVIAETLAWWVGMPRGEYSVDEIATLMVRLLTSPMMLLD